MSGNAGGISEKAAELAKKNREEFKKKKSELPKAPAFFGDSSYMSYPIARSGREDTGDTLLIKCVEYVPPDEGSNFGFELENSTAEIELADGTKKTIVTTEGNLKNYTISDGKGNLVQPTRADFHTKDGKVQDMKFVTEFTDANSRINAKKKTKYNIELPIPQEVNDANSVTWGEDSLNIFQLAGLAAAQRIMTNPGESFQEVSQLLQKGINLPNVDDNVKNAVLAGISGQAINALGGNVSPGSVIARSTGQILNSNLELLFKGVNLRSFPFSVTFSPRNFEEAIRVKTIIRYLKQTMAPKTGVEGGGTGIFLKSPDVFSLRYLHKGADHPFLNSFKLCALTGLSVNYTNAGTYASYDGGTPVNIRMNMTFKELNPIYSEDYEGMGDNDGVGF